MPLYKGTRRVVTYEEVQVEAQTYYRAMEMIEEDETGVEVLSEREGDYEVEGKLVVVEPKK